MTAQHDAIVVGAGPAGLVVSRQLKEKGLNYLVLERNDKVGGIWNIDAPNTPMYDSAHFISSKTLSGFPGYPMPDHYPDYPNHKQLLVYIQGYAQHFDLLNSIRFNTEVETATQTADGTWNIELVGGEVLTSRYLICANGVTWNPNTVSWPGDFDGEVRHSVSYRSSSEFEGKRVLIVGAGNSGVDIACDASFTADQAFLSVRRGYHFVPKHLFGKPADVFAEEGPKLPFFLQQKIFGGLLRMINGDLRHFGLPKPDHKVFQSHPIMNTQILHYLGHGDCIAKSDVERLDGKDVVFTDGSREQIDLIITATGYQHSVPFLTGNQVPNKNGRPDLYMNMFPRNTPNMAMIGFIEFASAAYANFELMAELIVADAAGSYKELSDMKQNHHPDLSGGHNYLSTERNANYVDVDTYLKTLSNIKTKLGLTARAFV
ncbi:MAG: NAD(P)-binding domain-containing protein [Pseudomonadota bacterium]